jgi:hypothetical protein
MSRCTCAPHTRELLDTLGSVVTYYWDASLTRPCPVHLAVDCAFWASFPVSLPPLTPGDVNDILASEPYDA